MCKEWKKRDAASYDHLDDQVLVSAADGELGDAQQAMVRAHLDACWACRARMEKIGRAIEDVIDYRAALVARYSAGSTDRRALLAARLRQAEADSERFSSWQHLSNRLNTLARDLQASRIAWAVGALAICAVVFWVRMAVSPSVSANALLKRAQMSEQTNRTFVKHPVVYQKLRIRSAEGTLTRTIYHDLGSDRRFETNNATQGEIAGLQGRMRAANLDWQQPLSIANFISWRAALNKTTDEVTGPTDGLITLHTRTEAGPLQQVDLTLRDRDYHAVAETLYFQDENIELSEIDFSVLAFESVNPTVFAPPPSVSRQRRPTPVATIPLVPEPSARDLAEAEVRARLILHCLHADLGEPIEVSRERRAVIVSGILESSERKEQLQEALVNIPHVKSRLTSVEEAVESAPGRNLEDEKPYVAVESAPPLENDLEKRFPDPSERTRFLNDTLASALTASARAWSLRRLSDRYTSEVTSYLDPNSKHRLELLIRDDVGLLQQEIDGLSARILQLEINDRDISSRSQGLKDFDDEPPSWHWRVDSVFFETQRIENGVSALLSGSVKDNGDAQALLRDLLLSIKRVETRLPVLYQQVSGDFLADVNRNAEIRELRGDK